MVNPQHAYVPLCEHTGVPPEELEDADLAAAMQELGFPDEDVSSDDADQ